MSRPAYTTLIVILDENGRYRTCTAHGRHSSWSTARQSAEAVTQRITEATGLEFEFVPSDGRWVHRSEKFQAIVEPTDLRLAGDGSPEVAVTFALGVVAK